MRKIMSLSGVVLIVCANIFLTVSQVKPESNISIRSMFNINSATAEHTTTVPCKDIPDNWDTYSNSGWGHNQHVRNCTASDCGWCYIFDFRSPNSGTCTLTIP